MTRVSKVVETRSRIKSGMTKGKSPLSPLKIKGEGKKRRNDAPFLTTESDKAIALKVKRLASLKVGKIDAREQGARLNAFVALWGGTKKEFSAKAGIPYGTLKRYCNGERLISDEHKANLEKHTNIFIPCLNVRKSRLICMPVVYGKARRAQ
jgi:hypothetical protein